MARDGEVGGTHDVQASLMRHLVAQLELSDDVQTDTAKRLSSNLHAEVVSINDDVTRDFKPASLPPSRRLHTRVRTMRGERGGSQIAIRLDGSSKHTSEAFPLESAEVACVLTPIRAVGLDHMSIDRLIHLGDPLGDHAPKLNVFHVQEAMGGVRDVLVPIKQTKTPNVSHSLKLQRNVTESIWVNVDVPDGTPANTRFVAAVHVVLAKPENSARVQEVVKNCLRMRASHAMHALNEIASAGEGASAGSLVDSARKAIDEQTRIIASAGVARLAKATANHNSPHEVLLTLTVEIEVCSHRLWDHRLPFLLGISEEVAASRSRAKDDTSFRHELFEMLRTLLSLGCDAYVFRNLADMEVHCYSSPYAPNDARSIELFRMSKAFCVPVQPPVEASNDNEYWTALRDLSTTHCDLWLRHVAYAWDEPTHLDHYDRLRARVSAAEHKLGSPLRVLTTFYCGPKDVAHPTPDSFESLLTVPEQLRGSACIYSVSAWALGERPNAASALKGRMRSSDEMWSYVCMGPGDPHPNWHARMGGLQMRAVGWRAWSDGNEGFLYWGANCYRCPDNPASPVVLRDGLPPGDGVLVYPGDVYGRPEITMLTSVRLERALAGLADAAWLEAHAALHGRDSARQMIHKFLYRAPNAYAKACVAVDAFRDACWSTL
ncbi:DUF4091 domain-containing protein [Pseudoscourfieldia marina]